MVECTKKKCQKLNLVNMKGVKHYKRDGTEHKGSSHKMSNGDLHTNKSHTKTSVKLFHFKDLSKKAKVKAKGKK
jgi:hypothetical protein